MKPILSFPLGFILTLILLSPALTHAQDFVYTPKNPAFGGSYLNYQWLLSSANAQNKFKGSSSFGYNRDPLANFEEQLQRQVLSQLTRDVIQDRFGDVNLNKQNSFEFGEFSIDIFPGSNGIDINITNSATGEQTTVTIPSF